MTGLLSLLVVVIVVIGALVAVVAVLDREAPPVEEDAAQVSGAPPGTSDTTPGATPDAVPDAAPSRLRDDVGVVGIGTSDAPHCSGVPLRATPFVVTATHCLMVHTTRGVRLPRRLLILRHGHRIATATAATVDPRYLLDADPRFDVSVVETDTIFDIGVDGYGAVDDDQADVLGLQVVEGDVGTTRAGVFGCRATDLVPDDRATFIARCGLGRGASGGPVVVRRARVDHHERDVSILVGVVSTFDEGQPRNGVSPVAERLDELFGPDAVGMRVVFDETSALADQVKAGLDGPERLVRRLRHGDPLAAIRIAP